MVCSPLSLVDGEPLEKVGISGRLARVEQQVKKIAGYFCSQDKESFLGLLHFSLSLVM